jgi:hypothetical protein
LATKKEKEKLNEERGGRMAKNKVDNQEVTNVPMGQDLIDLLHGGSHTNMGFPLTGLWNIIGDSGGGKTAIGTQGVCDISNYIMANRSEEYSTVSNEVLDGEDGNSFNTQAMYGVELQKDPTVETIEGVYCNISRAIEKNKKKNKGKLVGKHLHIIMVDSLDSFASGTIVKRGQDRVKADDKGKVFDEGSYLLDKQKYISTEMLPDLVPRLKNSGVFVIIISQIREKMNVSFGNKIQPTGGKALQFYINLRTLVAESCIIRRTVKGKKYPIGQLLKIKMLKVRNAKPGRDCYGCFFPQIGLDNVYTNLVYLHDLVTDTGQLKDDAASKNLSWAGTSSDELKEANKANIYEFLLEQERDFPGLKKSTSKKDMLEIIMDDVMLEPAYEAIFGSGMDVETLAQYVYDNDLEGELKQQVLDKWLSIENELAIVGRKRKF